MKFSAAQLQEQVDALQTRLNLLHGQREAVLYGQREVLLNLLRGAAALMETGLFETAEDVGNQAAYSHLREMQRAINDLDALRARGE